MVGDAGLGTNADIGELEKVRFVMKDGQVVRNDLPSH